MKRLFIHNVFFRLLCPFFSGALVYILILLINNNVEQLRESFLGQELYVCIGLAFIIQEYSRFSLLFFDKLQWKSSQLWQIILQLVCSIVITIVLVTLVMTLYFKNYLGYTPNVRELLIFNSIFSFIAIMYMMLFFAHQFLYKTNTSLLDEEKAALKEVEMNFSDFKSEINIDLLFESLESLIVLMKHDPLTAENFIGDFSSVYRHVLNNRNNELILFTEEFKVVKDLVSLFENLPYRRIELHSEVAQDFYVLPSSMTSLVEKIVRSSISSDHLSLQIRMRIEENALVFSYQHEDNLTGGLQKDDLSELTEQYLFYSSKEIRVTNINGIRSIFLPKLMINESLHS